MINQNLFRMFATAAFGLLVGMMATSAPAQETMDPNDPCVASCRETARDCQFDTREAHKLCLEEQGCAVLRDDYRAACLVADRDEEVCSTMRQALRDCVDPCRDQARSDGQACREVGRTCLTEECGIEKPERPRRGRFARGEGDRRPPRSERPGRR